jgi:predicted peptidase
MKKFFFTILLVILGASLHTQAQSLTKHINKVEQGYNLWLYTPAQVDTLKPLVIFLHGRSLCGTDMNKVRKYGTITALERGLVLDAYVMAPQNPGGAWKPEKIKRTMDWVVRNYGIDSTRIYVLGMSLGGYGTIDFAATYPDHIAAAIAMGGGGTRKDYCGLAQMPLWIGHGTADNLVNVRESDKVVNAMKACPEGASRCHYDRMPGMNHGIFARAFYKQETYDWLFLHSLTDEGRRVKPKTYTMSHAAFQGVYNNLKSIKPGSLIK